MQYEATVIERIGKVRLKRQSALIAGQCVIETLQIPECKAKVGEESRTVRLDVNRALDQRDGRGWVLSLKFDQAEEMQSIGIVGVLGEYLSIKGGRFTKPACLMKREGLLKHGTGPAF